MSNTKIKIDSEIIESLGGCTAVAVLMGFDKDAGGVQRVFNWKLRGIPAQVILNNPGVFDKAIRNNMEEKKKVVKKKKV